MATGKEKGVSGKKVRGKSGKSKSQAVSSEDTVTLRDRVHNTVKKQEAAAKRQHKLYFYPAPREEDDFDSDGERMQAHEIRKLRKELQQYMKQMEELKNERPEVLKNKDKRLKRRRDGDVRLSDEDVDQRQVVRAEEQAARSARMLYVLQRQVIKFVFTIKVCSDYLTFISHITWSHVKLDTVRVTFVIMTETMLMKESTKIAKKKTSSKSC